MIEDLNDQKTINESDNIDVNDILEKLKNIENTSDTSPDSTGSQISEADYEKFKEIVDTFIGSEPKIEDKQEALVEKAVLSSKLEASFSEAEITKEEEVTKEISDESVSIEKEEETEPLSEADYDKFKEIVDTFIGSEPKVEDKQEALVEKAVLSSKQEILAEAPSSEAEITKEEEVTKEISDESVSIEKEGETEPLSEADYDKFKEIVDTFIGSEPKVEDKQEPLVEKAVLSTKQEILAEAPSSEAEITKEEEVTKEITDESVSIEKEEETEPLSEADYDKFKEIVDTFIGSEPKVEDKQEALVEKAVLSSKQEILASRHGDEPCDECRNNGVY